MWLNPYLMFNGRCETAFKFYEKCLLGKIVIMMRYADTPIRRWPNKCLLSGATRSSMQRSSGATTDCRVPMCHRRAISSPKASLCC
jgi:uncharacterized glyoxalase superfamily protein PhnB